MISKILKYSIKSTIVDITYKIYYTDKVYLWRVLYTSFIFMHLLCAETEHIGDLFREVDRAPNGWEKFTIGVV